jgi:hypothetical protein
MFFVPVVCFQLRLKKLVFSIFEQSIESWKSSKVSVAFPEWQNIQYLLPCFVTLIGEIAGYPENYDTDLKIYTDFVHRLVQSFELHLVKEHFSLKKDKVQPAMNEEESAYLRWFAKNKSSNMPALMDYTLEELGLLVFSDKDEDVAKPLDSTIEKYCFIVLKGTFGLESEFHNVTPLKATWTANFQCFLSRMRTAIRKSKVYCQLRSPYAKSLQRAVVLITELFYVGLTCSDKPYDNFVLYLKERADWQLRKMTDPEAYDCGEVKVKKELAAEVQKLSVEQILGLLLFNVVVVLQNCDPAAMRNLFPPRPFHSAVFNSALEACASKKWSDLRFLISPLMCDKRGENPSFVTVDFARNSASSCYKRVLDMVDQRSDELKIFSPVVPVKLCKNCSKSGSDMKMCSLCEKIADFPDTYWFCSWECEKTCLDGGHLGEHNRHMLEKCDLV